METPNILPSFVTSGAAIPDDGPLHIVVTGGSVPHAYVHSATASSGTAIAGGQIVAAQHAFAPELPHDPSLGPIDVVTGSLLAATTFAIAVCRFRDTFRFSRIIDGSGDPGPG